MKKVFIDAGHGGKDSGAIGNGMYEKNITLPVALKVGEILTQHKVVVKQTRTTDTFVELKDRAAKANKWGADVFVSIHCNAFDNPAAQGTETFSHTNSTRGTALAKSIHDNIIAKKLYTKNRGIKKANFLVLRETKMVAALTELAFITNQQDATLLKTKQNEFAAAIAKGILDFLGIKYQEATAPAKGTPIIGTSKATINQMQEWAKNKKAHQTFIDLAPTFHRIATQAGINQALVYAQAAKETGYMKFGGVLNATYFNPCGLKTSQGGSNTDPKAHQRFRNWEEGIQAQVDHLALYAGAKGYPKANTPDPRHFPYLKGRATTVESLGGKWATGLSYGTDIVDLMKEIEATPAGSQIKINLLGRPITANGKLENGVNYLTVKGKDIPIRDIFEEALNLQVGWENNTVIIK